MSHPLSKCQPLFASVGTCLETPTPWNPEVQPPTEEEAMERAKDILVSFKR